MVDLQGSIRENLDPMGLHSDRDMMALLKDVGLWDILAGLSLSRSKAAGQPIPASIPRPSSAASSVPIGRFSLCMSADFPFPASGRCVGSADDRE